MKKLLPFLPLLLLALSSCASTGSKTAAAHAVQRGMTKGQIKSTLGKPTYKYAVDHQETWVYREGNPLMDKAKSTALNMVPMVGPLLSLAADYYGNAETATTAVSFGKDDKVTRIEETNPPETASAPTRVGRVRVKR